MYGGSGDLARRLAVQPHPPAPLAEVLEQLDRPVPAAGPQTARRPRERLPDPVSERLEQQHLAFRPRDRNPRGNDSRVVDDDQLVAQKPWKIGDFTVPGTAEIAVVDEEPSLVASLSRMLGDQLRRKVVVQLG